MVRSLQKASRRRRWLSQQDKNVNAFIPWRLDLHLGCGVRTAILRGADEIRAFLSTVCTVRRE